MSVNDSGNQLDTWSFDPSISSDGQRVAFTTSISEDGNTNAIRVRDRTTGDTIPVSVTPSGVEGNGDSQEPRISRNGQYVVFHSTSDNLVTGDTNGLTDVFVRNLDTNETELVSVALGGGSSSVFSWKPSISAGGRYIAFQSPASDLASNATSDSGYDVFVRDMQTDTTTQVSLRSDGTRPTCEWQDLCDAWEPEMSADGEYLVFHSAGQYAPHPYSYSTQVFRVELDTGTVARVTQAHANADPQDAVGGSEAQISSDGSVVAYTSSASGMTPNDSPDTYDALVYDFGTGATTRVSAGANDSTYMATVSGDGTRVGFISYADNLDGTDNNGSPDGFVYNRSNANVTRVTEDANGGEADWDSWQMSFADNSTVVFMSHAENLIGSNDTNGCSDVFVKSL